MIIYKIENKVNGKIYIGQTKKSLWSRLKSHLYNNSHLGNALRKYGPQHFDISVIDFVDFLDPVLLNELEMYWIKAYNSIHPNGYNLTNGGDGFSDPTGRIAKKISETLTGRKHSEETKKKRGKSVSKALKNKPWTIAQRKTHCDGRRKGRKAWNKYEKLSKKHCKHISEGLMGHDVSDETKEKLRKPNLKVSKALKDKPWSVSRREAQNNRKLEGKKNKPYPEVSKKTRQKQRDSHSGKPWSIARREAYNIRWGISKCEI